MTNKVYFARGMTALLDAIGKTANTVAARQQTAAASAVPAKTVVVIMTDGMENASKEYHYADVKTLIERQQKEFGWEFLFMGANRFLRYNCHCGGCFPRQQTDHEPLHSRQHQKDRMRRV